MDARLNNNMQLNTNQKPSSNQRLPASSTQLQKLQQLQSIQGGAKVNLPEELKRHPLGNNPTVTAGARKATEQDTNQANNTGGAPYYTYEERQAFKKRLQEEAEKRGEPGRQESIPPSKPSEHHHVTPSTHNAPVTPAAPEKDARETSTPKRRVTKRETHTETPHTAHFHTDSSSDKSMLAEVSKYVHDNNATLFHNFKANLMKENNFVELPKDWIDEREDRNRFIQNLAMPPMTTGFIPSNAILSTEANKWLVLANSGVPNFPQFIRTFKHPVGEFCMFEDIKQVYRVDESTGMLFLKSCRDIIMQLYQICYALKKYGLYTDKIHFKVTTGYAPEEKPAFGGKPTFPSDISQTDNKHLYKVGDNVYFKIPVNNFIIVTLDTTLYSANNIPDIAYHYTVKKSIEHIKALDPLFYELRNNGMLPDSYNNMYTTTVLESVLLTGYKYLETFGRDLMIPLSTQIRPSVYNIELGSAYLYQRSLFIPIAFNYFGTMGNDRMQVMGYSIIPDTRPTRPGESPIIKISSRQVCSINDLTFIPPVRLYYV